MSLKPTDIHALRQVSSPSLSPDGSTLIYVVASTCEDEMTTRSRLMMCQVPEGRSRAFSSGPKDSSPKHSPDGQTVGFLRPESDGDKSQLWLISTGGGEAQRLTDLPGGVREFAWAPDCDRLVVVSRVDPDAVGKDEADVPKTQVVRRIRYRDDGDGWRGDAFSQLFVVDVDGGEPRQLTDGEGDHLAPVWSPAGEWIAYVSDEVDERDFTRHSEIRAISADGGDAELWSEGLSRVAIWTRVG